jgi:hypothetical protein
MVVVILTACNKKSQITGEEVPYALSGQSNLGEIHNEILLTYFTEYDTTGWANHIKQDRSQYLENGEFSYSKFAAYFLDNVDLYFDEDLYVKTVESVFQEYGRPWNDSLAIPIPFDDEFCHDCWDVDGLYGGYDLFANRDSLTYYRYIYDAGSTFYTSLQLSYFEDLGVIITDTTLNAAQKNSAVNTLANNFMGNYPYDDEFVNYVEFSQDVASFYASSGLPEMLWHDSGQRVDNDAFEEHMAQYACTCERCGSLPGGISHYDHWNHSVSYAAEASLSVNIYDALIFLEMNYWAH